MSKSAPIDLKIYSPAGGGAEDALDDWLAQFPRPWVFTNGCFDILHRGHVTHLETAATLGATLLVGVNSDASVRLLGKGGDRPINCLQDRMALLAALASVDAVISYEQATPLELILQVQPEHLVKGGDWSAERMVGGKQVIRRGGQVHSLSYDPRFQHSTSKLIARIRAASSA